MSASSAICLITKCDHNVFNHYFASVGWGGGGGGLGIFVG